MAKKIEAYIKLQVPAGQANPSHLQLVQHWVSTVLTSWNSVKHSTLRLRAWKMVCQYQLLSLYTLTAASHSSLKLLQRLFC